ncbi:hypothetical protein GUITHDRAFT_112963 [Guillardia theta CCMP2712]|uniref:Uncharacterized protein n=1 Tax=Guillardia theta (strain CCMP2712) TaxID=905079 RepID=L1IXG1_GUITC|nr:hypothetical protein GUITHDRAFT_112963 [Guillardia theta CCMP2712]EKX40958.1 hypothetical protein GUITHDRAFT_112963 [Guillardia theta CCMP2712]|eukprot:XP_005827938.1 hypothetical protein GUITHDRAFT_112963 [Guillardia theta CCMP2712]
MICSAFLNLFLIHWHRFTDCTVGYDEDRSLIFLDNSPGNKIETTMVRDFVQDVLDDGPSAFGLKHGTPHHLTNELLSLTFGRRGGDTKNDFGCWNDGEQEIIQQLEELSKQTKTRDRRKGIRIEHETATTYIKFHKSPVKEGRKESKSSSLNPPQGGSKIETSYAPNDGRLKPVDMADQFMIVGMDHNSRKHSNFFASRPRRDSPFKVALPALIQSFLTDDLLPKVVELVNRSFPLPDRRQENDIPRNSDTTLIITNFMSSKDDLAAHRREFAGRLEEHRHKLVSPRKEEVKDDEHKDLLAALSVNLLHGGSRGRGARAGGSVTHCDKTESVSSNSSAGRSNCSKASSSHSDPVSHEHLLNILDVQRLAALRQESFSRDQVQQVRIHREEDSDSEHSKHMGAINQNLFPPVRNNRLGMRKKRASLKSQVSMSPNYDSLPSIIVSFSPKRTNARLRLDKLDRGAISESDLEYATPSQYAGKEAQGCEKERGRALEPLAVGRVELGCIVA